MLTLLQVHEMLAAIGVSLANPSDACMNPMTFYQDATRTAALSAAVAAREVIDKLQPAAPRKFIAAKWLLDIVNVDASKADALANVHFVVVTLGLDAGDVDKVRLSGVTRLRTGTAAFADMQRQTLLRFAKSRAATAQRALIEIADTLPGPPATNLTTLVSLCDELIRTRPTGNDTARFSRISSTSFADLSVLYATYPPDSGFAGFTAWGPGNHGDPVTNLDAHFKKHVCGIIPPGDDPLEYQNEFSEWWAVLKIRLPLNEVKTRLASGSTLPKEVAGWFYGVNEELALSWLEEFIRRKYLEDNPAVVAYLVAAYRAAYGAYAIQASRHFAEAVVQTEANKTAIAGWKNVGGRDLFIIGRRDDTGALGISSAYFTPDRAKIAGSADKMVYRLI